MPWERGRQDAHPRHVTSGGSAVLEPTWRSGSSRLRSPHPVLASPRSPTAEVTPLKGAKCRFESDRGYALLPWPAEFLDTALAAIDLSPPSAGLSAHHQLGNLLAPAPCGQSMILGKRRDNRRRGMEE